MRVCRCDLFREAYRACFADNGNFHLARISHLILDALGYFCREFFGFCIVDLIGTYNHAQLTAGLDCIGLDHAGIAESQLLKVVETLDVSFDHFTAGTGAGA